MTVRKFLGLFENIPPSYWVHVIGIADDGGVHGGHIVNLDMNGRNVIVVGSSQADGRACSDARPRGDLSRPR